MTDKAATLGVEGTNHQFMLLEGSVGPEVIDIRKLYSETGMFTYDPGFTSTADHFFEAWLEERGLAPGLTPLVEDARGRLLRQLESILERTGRGRG